VASISEQLLGGAGLYTKPLPASDVAEARLLPLCCHAEKVAWQMSIQLDHRASRKNRLAKTIKVS
jgi:hypothetical protein